jgi:hypothetical protein
LRWIHVRLIGPFAEVKLDFVVNHHDVAWMLAGSLVLAKIISRRKFVCIAFVP